MKEKTLDFSEKIILSDNQYNRLLPTKIIGYSNVDEDLILRIQRTNVGKIGELVFEELLKNKNKKFSIEGMFEIYEGQENVDEFDFITKDKKTVDIKTGFLSNHKNLLINEEQFSRKSKDYYVGIKLKCGGKDGVLQKHEWYSNTNCPGPYLGSKFQYIAEEVNKRLRASKTVRKPISGLYRVRRSWSDVKSQKGAFKNLDNAKRCAYKFRLKVFDESGKVIYPVEKTIDQLAREVIRGNWGNGEERKRRLTNAGYDYNKVQRRVNKLI